MVIWYVDLHLVFDSYLLPALKLPPQAASCLRRISRKNRLPTCLNHSRLKSIAIYIFEDTVNT